MLRLNELKPAAGSSMNQSVTIPLSWVSSGKKVRIVSLNAGRGLAMHLYGMGLGIGSEVEVIRRGAPGPFLVAVKQTRLAIGMGMANKIMVVQD